MTRADSYAGTFFAVEVGAKLTLDNATIDASIYLDYAAGIEAGVYKWVLSDDETYYTLCAVDEAGEPLTAQETAINVGANNVFAKILSVRLYRIFINVVCPHYAVPGSDKAEVQASSAAE